MVSDRRVIFQADTIRLILDERGGDTVFVSFNAIGFIWDGDHYWGEKLFAPMPYTVLGFVTPEPNWYPPEDMKGAIAAAIAAVAGRRVITYGWSQGGYGALKFSKALGATTSLAFSPLWSINPAEVGPNDPRTTQYYQAALKTGHKIEAHELCPRNLVFYDPHEPYDRWNAGKISEYPATETVIMPFGGHETLRTLIDSKTIGQIVRRGASPDIAAAELRGIIRSGRRSSPAYRQGKLDLLLKRAKRGTGFIENELADFPNGPFKTLLRATTEAYRGNHKAAADIIKQIPDSSWLENDLFALWQTFRSTKFREGELKVASLLSEKYPDDPFQRLHAVNTYINFRLPEAAVAELSVIVKMPGAHKRANIITDFCDRLRRPDLLARFLESAPSKN